LVDLWEIFGDPAEPEFLFPDGLHPASLSLKVTKRAQVLCGPFAAAYGINLLEPAGCDTRELLITEIGKCRSHTRGEWHNLTVLSPISSKPSLIYPMPSSYRTEVRSRDGLHEQASFLNPLVVIERVEVPGEAVRGVGILDFRRRGFSKEIIPILLTSL
jgi:hypothetical protein